MNSPEFIRQLATAGLQAPSADNSQPLHFTWNGEVLSISYDSGRVGNSTFSQDSLAALLTAGASVENICCISNSYKVNPHLTWLPDTGNRPSTYADISFDKLPSDTHVGAQGLQHDLFNRHTNRFPFHTTPLPSEVNQQLPKFQQGNTRLLLVEQSVEKMELWKMVKSATEIRFQTQQVHEWLTTSLRLTKTAVKKADGLDIRTLGLPPGGSSFFRLIGNWRRMNALNKIKMYKLLAKIDAAPIKAAPAIIAVIGTNSHEGAADAGRSLSRCWTELNSEGLAVHPYYVLADQLARLNENTVPKQLTSQAEQLKLQCSKFFTLGNEETLHMLLRVGFPKKSNPPRSLRLPLEKVFTDSSRG